MECVIPHFDTQPSEMDPHGLDQHAPGAKLDAGKVRAELLHDFSLALEAVAKIATMGAAKYTAGGWQYVPNGEQRYHGAGVRHWLKGRQEDLDPDSGYPHLYHEAWNVLAQLELRLRRERDEMMPAPALVPDPHWAVTVWNNTSTPMGIFTVQGADEEEATINASQAVDDHYPGFSHWKIEKIV